MLPRVAEFPAAVDPVVSKKRISLTDIQYLSERSPIETCHGCTRETVEVVG